MGAWKKAHGLAIKQSEGSFIFGIGRLRYRLFFFLTEIWKLNNKMRYSHLNGRNRMWIDVY